MTRASQHRRAEVIRLARYAHIRLLVPATGAWMSEPPAEQDGDVLAAPPPRARRLVFAAVTGLALAVALAAAGVIIANRQPPPRPVATLSGPRGQAPCS